MPPNTSAPSFTVWFFLIIFHRRWSKNDSRCHSAAWLYSAFIHDADVCHTKCLSQFLNSHQEGENPAASHSVFGSDQKGFDRVPFMSPLRNADCRINCNHSCSVFL